MQLECMIRRVGMTPVDIEGVRYNFFPIPGSKKGEETTSVCEVNTEKHLQYLLHPRRGGAFREYDPERALEEMRMAGKKKSPMSGYSFQKYLEQGYIVADYRNKDKSRYAGSDGNWVESRSNMVPFQTEIQAFEWLKSEVEFDTVDEGLDEMPDPAGPPAPKVKGKSKE